MIRRLRLVLPRGDVLAVLVIFHLMGVALDLFWFRQFQEHSEVAIRLLKISMVFATIGQAAFRVFAFHPFFDGEYKQWLERTPWRWPRPLPAGPVGLVWEDAVIVGALTGLAWYETGLSPLVLPTVYLSVRAAFLAAVSSETCVPLAGWLMAYGLGGIVWAVSRPDVMVGLTLAVTLVGEVGLRQALRRFPWDRESPRIAKALSIDTSKAATLGWPYDRLGPRIATPSFGGRGKILLALLLGWLAFTFSSAIPMPEERTQILAFVSCLVIVCFSCVRLAVYAAGHASPLDLWGRFRLGRWIIPGHDQVFVGPVLVVFAGMSVPFTVHDLGASWPLAMSITISVVALLGLLTGPDQRRWRLTGRVRITPPLPSQQYVRVG
jgi:hypothetical protein